MSNPNSNSAKESYDTRQVNLNGRPTTRDVAKQCYFSPSTRQRPKQPKQHWKLAISYCCQWEGLRKPGQNGGKFTFFVPVLHLSPSDKGYFQHDGNESGKKSSIFIEHYLPIWHSITCEALMSKTCCHTFTFHIVILCDLEILYWNVSLIKKKVRRLSNEIPCIEIAFQCHSDTLTMTETHNSTDNVKSNKCELVKQLSTEISIYLAAVHFPVVKGGKEGNM